MSNCSAILSRPTSRPLRCALWLVVLLAPLVLKAQTAITAWTLGNSDLANTTAYASPTLTFQNTTYNVTSFTAGTAKTVDSSATTTFIRRSGAGGNSNIWMIDDGAATPTTFRGMNPSAGTLADVLSGNNVLQGGNDLFVNTGGSPTTVNTNVERIDFYWAGGFTTVSDQGFAVFDRGRNDGFQISIITGWDTGTNMVTTYGATKEVASSSYGAALSADWDGNGSSETTFTASALRYTTSGTLSTSPEVTDVGDTIGGVFVSFASLGIADGTRIYGYSLMATDVTDVLANMVDWTNSTYYPTTSGDNTNTSIDLVGFNGRRFVPEPATYGAMLIAAMAAFIGWRRRQPVPVRVRP